MEKIKPLAIRDIKFMMHLCPMAVPFVADENHPSGYHVSEDESIDNKKFINMDCIWSLRVFRGSFNECVFTDGTDNCPRLGDETQTNDGQVWFLKQIKSKAQEFKNHNK